MPVSINNTTLTFDDGTTQTTAASASSFVGFRGQVFTANGTFTIPTGITAVKVTVVGGGGGGQGFTAGGGCCPGTVIAGTTGSTSSVASGTQTITTISATGGTGGSASAYLTAGGLGSNGDLNFRGGSGYPVDRGASTGVRIGGSTMLSAGTFTNHSGASNGSAGNAYGAGGTGYTLASPGGGGGGTAIKWLTGLTPGNTLTVTRGAGGAGGNGATYDGGAGANGVIIFEW